MAKLFETPIKTDWQPVCWNCTTGTNEVRMELVPWPTENETLRPSAYWFCRQCSNTVPLEDLPVPEHDPISGKPLDQVVFDEPRPGKITIGPGSYPGDTWYEGAAAKCDRCQEVFPGSELQAVDPDGHGEAELCAKCLERMEQERAEEALIASCPDCGNIHPGPACHADDPEYRRV